MLIVKKSEITDMQKKKKYIYIVAPDLTSQR